MLIKLIVMMFFNHDHHVDRLTWLNQPRTRYYNNNRTKNNNLLQIDKMKTDQNNVIFLVENLANSNTMPEIWQLQTK